MSWIKAIHPLTDPAALSIGEFHCAELQQFITGCEHVLETDDLSSATMAPIESEKFGAVVIDNFTSAPLSTTDLLKTFVMRKCGDQCVIVLVGQCGQKLPQLIRRLRGRPGVDSLSMSSARRMLERLGFDYSQFYYASPGAGFGDSFETSDARGSDSRRVGFFAAVPIILRQLLKGRKRILIAARDCTPFASVQVVAEELGENHTRKVTVDGFVVRSRGTTVLSCRLSVTGRPIIVKVIDPGPKTDVAIKTHQFLQNIHEMEFENNRWRDLIPKSLGVVRQESMTITAEDKAGGDLAWKISRDLRESGSLVADALQFAFDLARATVRTEIVSADIYHRLIGADLNLLANLPGNPASAKDDLRAIAQLMKQQLLGQECSIVWGHGDFGLGNILCDTKYGRIAGVIDWDTCSACELPTIDAMNLLLQMHRTPDLLPSLRTLAERRTPDWLEMTDCFEKYTAEFTMASENILFFLAFSVLRLLARDQGYTGAALTGDQCEAIKYCLKIFDRTCIACDE